MAGSILQFIKTFLLGISVAQVIATIHLYFSNQTYYKMLSAIHEAGYLAVPNLSVMQQIKGFFPAFFGGLFFTATAGLFLTAIAFAAAWIWNYIFSRSLIPLLLIITIWLTAFLMFNQKGISPLITAYLFFIPCTVFPYSLNAFKNHPKRPPYLAITFNVILFIVFSMMCATQMKTERFLDIRDYLLLSNPLGEKINDFYYRNSLFAARVFRSYNQELLKTCSLQSIHDDNAERQFSRLLIQRDYLPIENSIEPDLAIIMNGNELKLVNRDKTVLSVLAESFLNYPDKSLKQFEKKTDRHLAFRAFTMISMLFNGAAISYLLIFIFPFVIFRLFFNASVSAILSGGVCVLLPLVLLFIWQNGKHKTFSTDMLAAALISENRSERIEALRYIYEKKIDILEFPAYNVLLANGNIPERYWLAKSISGSHTKQSREPLMRLLDDSHFNVVCMAFYAMGMQGRKSDIPIILDRIETSSNWYEQWYAYKALRKLGWRQKISGQNPSLHPLH
ncbi:MAG: HEAT repeat domain-containing protein [Desulfobacterales bacterium]